MRIRPDHLALAAAVVLLGAACTTTSSTTTSVSGTPVMTQLPVPVPPPLDPSGKWTIALVAQGQSMEVVMELAKVGDGYGGTLSSEAFPPIGITKGTLTGKQLVLVFPVPTGDTGTMTVTIEGDVMTGEWSMPGDGSKVSGKRAN